MDEVTRKAMMLLIYGIITADEARAFAGASVPEGTAVLSDIDIEQLYEASKSKLPHSL